jgi:hypothetical protein
MSGWAIGPSGCVNREEATRRLISKTRALAETIWIYDAARRALAALPAEAAVAGLDAERLVELSKRTPAEQFVEDFR